METRKRIIFFFIFAQNIPFGKLLQEKVVLVSSNLFLDKLLKVRKVHMRGSFNTSKQQNNVVTSKRPLTRKNNCGPTKLLTNFTL